MGNAIGKRIDDCFKAVKETVLNITRRILPPIVAYVVEHPLRTAFHVIQILALAVPGMITAPLLAMAGFTGGGIAAGSIAASVQSVIGPVAAGGVFATLQSAAMGGYGAATVARAMSGVAMAADVARR